MHDGRSRSVAVYPVASLALVHYLNGVARRALAAFRPALGVEESEYERLEYMLVTLPRRGTRITLALSLLFTAVYIVYTPYLVALFGRSPWIAVVESVVYVFCFAMILAPKKVVAIRDRIRYFWSRIETT